MNIWDGKYKDYREAEKFKKGKGFSGKKWKDSQLQILKICKSLISLKKKIPNKFTTRYKNFLFIIKKIFKIKKTINILDFGGGIGIGYFYLSENLNKNISYTIVEIPTFIKNIKNYKERNIIYTDKLNGGKFDIVICCSVFQYIKNWQKEIKKISKIKTKYIYFSDMFIGNIKSYATLQIYYQNKIPHWFLNFKEFDKELRKNRYKLIYSNKMKTKRLNYKNKLPMKNFKLKDRINYTSNLLYKRF